MVDFSILDLPTFQGPLSFHLNVWIYIHGAGEGNLTSWTWSTINQITVDLNVISTLHSDLPAVTFHPLASSSFICKIFRLCFPHTFRNRALKTEIKKISIIYNLNMCLPSLQNLPQMEASHPRPPAKTLQELIYLNPLSLLNSTRYKTFLRKTHPFLPCAINIVYLPFQILYTSFSLIILASFFGDES